MKKLSIYSIIVIVSTIMVTGSLLTMPVVNIARAQTPHITITEAYASAGTQTNGIFHPQKRISQGASVFDGQYLQFREDFTGSFPKILRVHCAIDGVYSYYNQCSTPFEGKSYTWILNKGIPTNNLKIGSHTFSVTIDTVNGRTNYATFNFFRSHAVCFEGPVVNGRCR